MDDRHLSPQEQEAYILGEKTPEQTRHIGACSACRAGIARMEYGIARFRESSFQWAEECMKSRLGPAPRAKTASVVRIPTFRLGWALAALLAVAVFLLHPWSAPVTTRQVAAPTASLSDDALLEQVDAQLAAGVPDSMHSLTHLVSADTSDGGRTQHE